MPAGIGGALIKTTTQTSGTGPFVLDAPPAGYRSFGVFANGTLAYCSRTDSSPAYEEGFVTVNTSGGITTLTWAPRQDTSNGGSTPVNWPPGGTQNVVCAPLATGYPRQAATAALAREGLGATTVGDALFIAVTAAAALAALGAGTAATRDTGTTNGTVPLWENLPSGPIPSGSVAAWYQAAAPSGWTRVTTVNDAVPIIVSAGSPGTTNGESWAIDDLSTTAESLTEAQLAAHDHSSLIGSGAGATAGIRIDGATLTLTTLLGATTGDAGSGNVHAHDVVSAGTWRPKGAFMLLASKN